MGENMSAFVTYYGIKRYEDGVGKRILKWDALGAILSSSKTSHKAPRIVLFANC